MSKESALDAINAIENKHPGDDMVGYWLSLIRVYIMIESRDRNSEVEREAIPKVSVGDRVPAPCVGSNPTDPIFISRAFDPMTQHCFEKEKP